MRRHTGYFITFLLFILFLLVLFQVTSELKVAKSFPAVLDEKIPIEKVVLTQTSYIKDSKGNVISEIHHSEKRTTLSADEIPQIVKDLFITIEDQHFYEHIGFDISGIGRAALINLQNDSIDQGGSTITQQLARNLYLTTEKSYNRKLSELLYSYQLERTLTKEEILTLYINAIYFQNGAYGIETASQFYFNQPIKDASLAKIAFLCAIPNNPSHYNPITNFSNTKERQERILQSLVEAKKISIEEYEAEVKEPIELTMGKSIDQFPDYTTYIFHEFEELIAEKEGFNKRMTSALDTEKKKLQKRLDKKVKEVLESGIIIETALNENIQQEAVQALKLYLPNANVQGAAAVINNQTNQIVAIAGGKNYEKFSFNRAYQAFRQPGSAIKPLLVYAPYFDQTGASISQTIDANNYCKNGYCPRNYGGGQYGNVSLRTAFKYSYNTPAIRLFERIGIEQGFSYLDQLHFSNVVKEDHSLPAAIGGFSYGMSPLEMTNAFATFANNGQFIQAHGITRVTDLKGNILYEWNAEPIEVWDDSANQKVRTLLEDVVQSGTGKEANFSSGYIGGKTGTTNDVKDLWFIGLTDQYTAGVWVGNDQNKSIYYMESRKPQIHIWKDIMKAGQQ
ncbi:transglycosylase domain-containing protein [Bacillus sp. REN16]|uniref:transglycosylase domain-containing protein n=1 Tax=Bacillus sp. REN16 TaxID=2887296 RepID=UPI001E429DDF|nr:transglycosylase domain-containing protein [Bacillus sp. REN16]MCC3355730.1 transglycosylase domain-containing protein [Bacillus sp. REN16]